MTDKKHGFQTRAVHEGRAYSELTGAVMPPVYLTSTFEAGNLEGFDCTRVDLQNDIAQALQEVSH